MKRRKFLTAISCLPFLGFLKPEYVMRPEDWKAGYMRAVADPRLIDPSDYHLKAGSPSLLTVEEASASMDRLVEKHFKVKL